MNLFRTPILDRATGEWTRPLDRKFLRVCAVYRLMKRGVIDKTRALEFLADRHTPAEMKTLRGTVELWSFK